MALVLRGVVVCFGFAVCCGLTCCVGVGHVHTGGRGVVADRGASLVSRASIRGEGWALHQCFVD